VGIVVISIQRRVCRPDDSIAWRIDEIFEEKEEDEEEEEEEAEEEEEEEED